MTRLAATLAAWQEALAAMEHDVEQVAVAVRDGDRIPLPSWTPPGALGPLPEELEPRARALSARIDEVRAAAQASLEGVGAQLRDLGRRRSAGAAYQQNDRTA